MPIRIKPAAQTKEKYKTRGQGAVPAYKEGVANPRKDQEQATLAANDTYVAAMNESLSEGRFEKGVAGSGAKGKANAASKGGDRLAGGIAAGADEWAKNTQPILDAMAAVPDLPRGVKGSEQNFQRQRAFARQPRVDPVSRRASGRARRRPRP